MVYLRSNKLGEDMKNFLKKYGIEIKNLDLLETAVTHSSYANENKVESYERLEFLGDAVLQVIVSEYLYKNSQMSEGKMSKERSSYVCEEALCYYVKKAGYNDLIRVGNGLAGHANDTIIADTFESVLAVIYLECGLDTCKEYIEKIVIPEIEKNEVFFKDYKTALQEFVQTDKKSLEYVLVNTKALPNNFSEFTISVIVDGIVLGTGKGHSKKMAEQNAAADALKKCAR